MAGRPRGRTGRGWDAAPPRAAGARGQRSRPAPGGQAATPAEFPEPAEHGGSPQPAGGLAAAPGGSPDQPDPAERAREICLRQLAVRPRTRAELAAALGRQGIPDEVIAEVLDRYGQVGMIDDAAFARAWVTSRHQGKGLAGRALGRELRQRGVDPETVGEALDELAPETELATARALVARKLRSTRGEPQAVIRKLVGMLARKGYPAGLAFRVVKEALADDERTAALADEFDADALAEAAGPDVET